VPVLVNASIAVALQHGNTLTIEHGELGRFIMLCTPT
jgi:hypothetical protein